MSTKEAKRRALIRSHAMKVFMARDHSHSALPEGREEEDCDDVVEEVQPENEVPTSAMHVPTATEEDPDKAVDPVDEDDLEMLAAVVATTDEPSLIDDDEPEEEEELEEELEEEANDEAVEEDIEEEDDIEDIDEELEHALEEELNEEMGDEEVDIDDDDGGEDGLEETGGGGGRKRKRASTKSTTKKPKKTTAANNHTSVKLPFGFARYEKRMRGLPAAQFGILDGTYLSDYGLSTAVKRWEKLRQKDPQYPPLHHVQLLAQIAQEKGVRILGFTSENKKQGKYEPLSGGGKREADGGSAKVIYVGKFKKSQATLPHSVFCLQPGEEPPTSK